MAQGNIGEVGRRNYTSRAKTYTMQAAKDRFVELMQNGMNINPALEKVGRSRKSYEEWRRLDPAFKAKVDQARQLRTIDKTAVRGEKLGFAEFRKKYLKTETFWHQLQWVDVLEGREPRDLHEAQIYTPGKRNRVIVNVPPFHCPTLDTPILTSEGWRTVADVEVGTVIYGANGIPGKVIETWEPEDEVDVYEVELATGDVLTVDGQHLWVVENPVGKMFEKSTLDLIGDLRYGNGAAKWRINVAEPATGRDPMGAEPAALPLDPYILGYWLGDGDTNCPRIAVGEQDRDDLLAQVSAAGYDYSISPQRGGYMVYIRGIRGILTQLGLLGHKHIPDIYAIAAPEQRRSLLQGLLDSDGSVTVKDGRVKFAQHPKRADLIRDTFRLIASLGYLPRLKDETKPGLSPGTGLPYLNEIHCIYFKPNGEPVFRLSRKAERQKLTTGKCKTNSRRIVDIRPAGKGRVKCLTATTPGNLYQLGDGCIVNHNAKSMTITIDYSVYRLCMDPSFRILIVSAGSLLASDFLYGIKQRLTSPDFIELQKAYAPEGGWEATAESWTDSRIIFGTETRSSGEKTTHEKDPNVQTVGMRSKIYGKRADLIVLDDAVDGTNVSEYGKQMTWLRREVSSRLEAGGKLLVVGTRIASVDLYSELMKPENYANGKSPWTYFASPAILEEGETPAEHKTLWPHSDQPWVQPGEDADECLCENPACGDGFELDGKRMFARWDGTHLEMGPRAENNNAEWALVYQQRSVPEDATFPEHAVTRAGQPLRLAGVLQSDQAGHPYTGMHGKYVIAGLDPSIKGFAGMIVVAVDRETNRRFVMNAWNLRAPTKDQLVEKMKQVTEHYSVNEWRVEKTGLLQFFTQDSVMRQWFSTRGVRFTEHFTGANKWDAAFGVSSLAALFGEYDKSWDTPNAEWREINAPLIELPRPNNDGIKALVHQLITWTPDLDPNKVPCDMVMALWFAEIGAREHLGYGRGAGSLTVFGRSNKFVSPRAGANRQTVRLADYQR